MKRAYTSIALLAFVFAALGTSTVVAQQARILDDDAWCDRTGWGNSDTEKYCEVVEIDLPANRDVIAVDGKQNGGVRVIGWDRNEIQVRARVLANARTVSAARELAGDVEIDFRRTIYADTPKSGRKEWVSVTFEVFVPYESNLDLHTKNGGITIEDVDGDVEFRALNGGVSLVNLAGNVSGRTTNGGLKIALSGDEWDGQGMDVETTNGGVTIDIPNDYSAQLESGTVNGSIRIDFPIMVQGEIGKRLKTELGEGGRLIRAYTTNGGVRIRKS